MSDTEPTFGQWLARQLRLKGMTQAELAVELEVTRAAVSAWVTDRSAPRLHKIQEIERILELPDGTVLSRQDAPDPTGALTWYHRPAYADGGREFGNAAAFAFEPDLAVLAREATQNSLDERFDPSRPVRVRYTIDEISGETLERFLRAVHWSELLPHLSASAELEQKVGRTLREGLADLREHGSLLLLRVDDYNANGLIGPEYGNGKFAAVVRRQLDSEKSTLAAGSYGLGKSTLWAASRLGLVLINSTLSEPEGGRTERRLIGRLELPWREVAGEQFAGPGWFGVPDPGQSGATRSWWAERQVVEDLRLARESTDPGTSFLIVGAHNEGEEDDPTGAAQRMHDTLVRGLADNFWAAMIAAPGDSPRLEASVVARRNGEIVAAEERIDPFVHQPARSRALLSFLSGTTVDADAATSTDDVVHGTVPLVVPRRKGETGGPRTVEHEAVVLLVSTPENDENPNRLVGLRGNHMVVFDEHLPRVPPGTLPFQAVLLAGTAPLRRPGATQDPKVCEDAERFLRAAEPPEHNDWRRTEDLVTSYDRGAITGIKRFRAAARTAVRELLQRPEVAPSSEDGPAELQNLLGMHPPKPPKSPAYPTVKHAEGRIDASGAWIVHVEVRLPKRDDPWRLSPILRFATRSGPKPQVDWAELRPKGGCVVDGEGVLLFDGHARSASFVGVSAVESHPVSAHMAVIEVDLSRVKEAV